MNLYDKDLYATEDKFHIKHGSFYITKEQIDILNRYIEKHKKIFEKKFGGYEFIF